MRGGVIVTAAPAGVARGAGAAGRRRHRPGLGRQLRDGGPARRQDRRRRRVGTRGPHRRQGIRRRGALPAERPARSELRRRGDRPRPRAGAVHRRRAPARRAHRPRRAAQGGGGLVRLFPTATSTSTSAKAGSSTPGRAPSGSRPASPSRQGRDLGRRHERLPLRTRRTLVREHRPDHAERAQRQLDRLDDQPRGRAGGAEDLLNDFLLEGGDRGRSGHAGGRANRPRGARPSWRAWSRAR